MTGSRTADAAVHARSNGHVDAARLLLEKGVEVDRAAEDGATPLHNACEKGHAELLLLENGADANRVHKCGSTPLYVACEKGNADVARLLLENGADATGRAGFSRCTSRARKATSTWRGCC